VSPAFIRLPYGPLQLGISAPAASPIKLRAEQEEPGPHGKPFLDRLEELEGQRKRGGDEARAARERSLEIDEGSPHHSPEIGHPQVPTDPCADSAVRDPCHKRAGRCHVEQIETEIKRLQVLLRELDEHPEEAGDAALEEAIHGLNPCAGGKTAPRWCREQRLEAAEGAMPPGRSGWA